MNKTKPWLKTYPPEVSEFPDTMGLNTVIDILNFSLARYADQTAFVSLNKEMSFSALDKYSTAFATWLQKQGYKKGDRIALMMPNLLQYPVCLLGGLKAGCVIVNCNPMYTPYELTHQLNDSGAKGIVIVENFAHTLEKAMPKLTTIEDVIITRIGDLLGIKGPFVNMGVRYVKKMIPAWHFEKYTCLKHIIKQKNPNFTPVEIEKDDIALLQYTGGTTGLSKGAMLTHGNVTHNALQSLSWIKPCVEFNKEFAMTALPLYHIFSFTANCLLFMILGSPNLLIVNPRDLKSLLRDFNRYPITAFSGVNTLFNAIIHHHHTKYVDFSGLKLAIGGGMAVQRNVAERWEILTGCTIAQGYGLTETSPVVSINKWQLGSFNGAVGVPVPGTEVLIKNEQGDICPLNEVGEICIRGPQVMKGYWNRPEDTQKVFDQDGFLHTGDMGYLNDEGFLFLVDRIKDVIIVSGFNVYPNEIEEVIASHPAVLECAAVGADNGPGGEVVKAFIVLKEGENPSPRDIIKYSRQFLTGYKTPKLIEFRSSLPKSDVGKILRKKLREH